MSRRQSTYITKYAQVDGGESPNRYIPSITVEIRAFHPPHLGHEAQVAEMIKQACQEACEQLEGK